LEIRPNSTFSGQVKRNRSQDLILAVFTIYNSYARQYGQQNYLTMVKATKRLVSDQSGLPGKRPCHCSLSDVGKSSKPRDSHSLQIIRLEYDKKAKV